MWPIHSRHSRSSIGIFSFFNVCFDVSVERGAGAPHTLHLPTCNHVTESVVLVLLTA